MTHNSETLASAPMRSNDSLYKTVQQPIGLIDRPEDSLPGSIHWLKEGDDASDHLGESDFAGVAQAGACPTDLMQKVAHSYQKFQQQHNSEAVPAVDDWASSHPDEF